MGGWKRSKIGVVCNGFDTFELKSVLTKNDAGDWGMEPDENAVGVIRSTNFNNNGKLDLSDIAYRTLTPKKFSEKKLCASDILIERSGGSETQPVGRVGFITDEMAKTDYAFANFIQRISLDDTVDAKFVYYCLQQMYEMGITAGMQSQTTGIRNLDWKQYIKVSLPKPSLSEQTAIATLLSKVDEAIEAVQDSIAAAERLKKSLMQNLLTGKMKPDGTFRTPEEFYTDEKFGKVPLGWEIKRVNDLFYLNQNVLPNRTDSSYRFRYITIESVNTESINFDNCDEFIFNESPGRARRIIKDGDILISGVRPNLKAFAIYRRPDSNNWICSTGFHVLTAKENVCSQFFFYQILSSTGASQFHSWVSGSNYPAIGDNDMRKMKLYVPPYEEQLSINHCIECLIKIQIEKQTEIKTLMSLRKSLLQHLLLGVYQVIK